MATKGYKQTKEHIKKRMKAWKKWFKFNSNYHSGEKSWNWKGGRRKYYKYIQILKPDYPFSTKSGYILEHRFVMEQHINRCLNPNEAIHHINGNPLDNRIENLLLTTKSEHCKMHPENSIKTRFYKGQPATKGSWKKGCPAFKTSFKKGIIPWSKLHPELCKPNSGSFKKGIIPWSKLNKGKYHLRQTTPLSPTDNPNCVPYKSIP